MNTMDQTSNDREQLYRSLVPMPLIKIAPKLRRIGFFDAPASTKYHGAYSGGLFDHSMTVARELVMLTDRLELKWLRPISPWVVGVFHDLCKADLYTHDGEKYVYKDDPILSGHGDKSVIVTQRLLEITDEEMACIRWHMGAFEKDTNLWKYYTNSIHRYPNVLYTHTADMIAAHINMI